MESILKVASLSRVRDQTAEQLYAELGITDEDDANDALLNPFETMDINELKKKLPPYMFMRPMAKAKYFKRITNDYHKKLKNSTTLPKTQRVNFQLDQSRTKVFDKLHKVGSAPVASKQGAKRILKKK